MLPPDTDTTRAVRRAVTRAGLTNRALADILDTSHGSIDRRLRGVTAWRLDELTRLAQHLGITVAELIGEPRPRRASVNG